jgi:hypothetical protein
MTARNELLHFAALTDSAQVPLKRNSCGPIPLRVRVVRAVTIDKVSMVGSHLSSLLPARRETWWHLDKELDCAVLAVQCSAVSAAPVGLGIPRTGARRGAALNRMFVSYSVREAKSDLYAEDHLEISQHALLEAGVSRIRALGTFGTPAPADTGADAHCSR